MTNQSTGEQVKADKKPNWIEILSIELRREAYACQHFDRTNTLADALERTEKFK